MTDRSRRDQVFHAAGVLFHKKGYHATTIRDIADEAGMLSGSLYAHIRTKEDLLFEITDGVADHFLTAVKTVAESDALPPQKLRQALAAHLRVIAAHLDGASVFMNEWKVLSPTRRAVIQEKRDAYEAVWARILADGAESGVFHGQHLRYARMVLLSVANWSYQWFDPLGSLTPDEVAERLVGVILRGLEVE